MSDFFSQLFTELNTEDSMAVLIFLFVAFLIGLVSGWLATRGKSRRTRKVLKAKEEELSSLRAELEGFREQFELNEADARRAELEAEEMRLKVYRLQEEKKQLNEDLQAMNEQLDKYRTRIESDTSLIDDLNNQVLGLKSRINQLNESLSGREEGKESEGSAITLETEEKLRKLEDQLHRLEEENEHLTALEAKVEQLEAQSRNLAELKQQVENLKNEALSAAGEEEGRESNSINILYEKIVKLENDTAGLKALAAKLQKLESDHARLLEMEARLQQLGESNVDLDKLSATLERLSEENQLLKEQLKPQSDTAMAIELGTAESETEVIDQPLTSSSAIALLDESLGTRIKRAEASEKDDLTRIDGIGPFIEEKLNGIGIFTYEQISQLDDELIEQVTVAIEFFPGRIRQDDWVGQAQRLLEAEGKAVVKVVTFEDSHNLKIVEGIGPKIEEVLHSGGIQTWADLAGADPEHLRILLSEAGDHFRIHDPATWPEQARLANEGRWEELEAYQEHLKGGREPEE